MKKFSVLIVLAYYASVAHAQPLPSSQQDAVAEFLKQRIVPLENAVKEVKNEVQTLQQQSSSNQSMLAAHKGQLDNIQADLANLTNLVKSDMASRGVQVKTTAPDWAGQAGVSVTPGSSWGASVQSSGAGACASGSCGSSGSGRMGLLGRRRR